MAFRGRGRGRGYGRGGRGYGGGGGGFGFAKQEPFILFPDVELPDKNGVTEEKTLVIWNARLQNFWKSSPYYIEEKTSKKSQSTDIERFSDRAKRRTKSKVDEELQNYLKLANFPQELVPRDKVQGSRRVSGVQKEVQWNSESDMQKLDFFEKLEQKDQGQDENRGKEKKEGENEEEDDAEVMEEEDEEFSDDGDYNQNIDFDDDEDDFNMEDDNDEFKAFVSLDLIQLGLQRFPWHWVSFSEDKRAHLLMVSSSLF
ncbi:hypothetical protein L1049_003913 [Liquidambar formosana]|uniref:DNA-directed RNA polymerase III subunit n=1 Tax=Liquidambar formosana TaxID=63359 RepID=A0AAP0WXY0_LIQFO